MYLQWLLCTMLLESGSYCTRIKQEHIIEKAEFMSQDTVLSPIAANAHPVLIVDTDIPLWSAACEGIKR